MSDDAVNIEVNGQPLQARKGQMLIQATDAAGIYIPRFCYHDKLSVAANCRMCLVEVEKAPKPLPACATPVAEGMKAFTSSPKAIAAQKATMEFLLINHPLDCPICDQGGECELQDLAQGFGREVSRFAERKRVVKDKNLGPLISTDMTRCIHCTRCVRFTSEIAGLQELGTTGRGEDMQIGTFVEKGIDHELSGNVIDLCPVGALNSKPFRFQGRSWEMTQHALVSPHDAVGTNLNAHVLRGRVMRIVPRENEAINETWIADRDRFSYEGIYADDRLQRPMLKVDGELRVTDWESALTAAAQGLKDAVQRGGAAGVGLLGSPTATTEELYLLAQLARRLGTGNVDTRLRQLDFTDQAADAVYPGLGMPLADVERLQALLVIGCHVRHEAPLLAHRIRKAAVRGTARVAFVNPAHLEFHFPVLNQHVAPAGGLVAELAALVAAAAEKAGSPVPADIGKAAGPVTAAHRATVATLAAEGERAILLGALASRHPAYADLRALAGALARLTGARLAYLPDGGNAAGAALAGALPHREPGGRPASQLGLDARAMLERPLRAYVLFGGIEPEADCLVPEAAQSIAAADFVVAITPFASAATRAAADVLLPIGTFAETSGTFVNVEGRWQSFAGCVKPMGEARPGWKVLRVLGNLLALPGFDYASSEEIRDELAAATAGVKYDPAYAGCHQVRAPAAAQAADIPMYRLDAILRRAPALQSTRDGRLAAAAP